MRLAFALPLVCLLGLSLAASSSAGEPAVRALPGGGEPAQPASQPKPKAKANSKAPGAEAAKPGPGAAPAAETQGGKPRLETVPLNPADRKIRTVDQEAVFKAPDLAVTTKAPSGSSTHYEFTIKNLGKAQAPATLLEVTLGPPCSKPGVMAKRKVLERAPIKSLAVTTSSSMAHKHGVELGSHAGTGCEIRGEIDPDGQVFEKSESNNVAAIGTAYHPKPDLVVVMRWGSGNDASQIVVKNTGDSAAPSSNLHMNCTNSHQSVMHGNHYWSCDPSGPRGYKEWNWPVPALAPGQQHEVVYPLAAPSPSHAVWHIRADSNRAVTESSETNNHRSNQ